MIQFFKRYLRPIFRKWGIDVVRYQQSAENDPVVQEILPVDFDEFHKRIYETVKEYTLTSPERLYVLMEAVKYLIKGKVEGTLVECGVWRGGSVMTMLLTLLEFGNIEREIYLYDTFSGMSAPTETDLSYKGEQASALYLASLDSESVSRLTYASIEEVKRNIFSTKYPEEKIHFVKGKVEDTIPEIIPEKIALLRLDTDWYESTIHELKYLFPRLSPKGVLICDDYGHWKGAKKAVDDYFSENNLSILLNRIDYTGRIGIKTS